MSRSIWDSRPASNTLLRRPEQVPCLLSAFFSFVNRHSTFSKHGYLVFARKSHLQCVKYCTVFQDVACRQEGTGKQTAQKRLVYTTGLSISHLSLIFSLLSICVLNISRDQFEFTSLELGSHYEGIAFICLLWAMTEKKQTKKNPTKYVGCQRWV